MFFRSLYCWRQKASDNRSLFCSQGANYQCRASYCMQISECGIFEPPDENDDCVMRVEETDHAGRNRRPRLLPRPRLGNVITHICPSDTVRAERRSIGILERKLRSPSESESISPRHALAHVRMNVPYMMGPGVPRHA